MSTMKTVGYGSPYHPSSLWRSCIHASLFQYDVSEVLYGNNRWRLYMGVGEISTHHEYWTRWIRNIGRTNASNVRSNLIRGFPSSKETCRIMSCLNRLLRWATMPLG